MMSRHPQHDCVWCSLLFEIIPFSGDSSILAGLVLFVHHQQRTPLSILLLRVNRLPSKIRAGACSLRTHASRALTMEVEDRGRMALLDNGGHGRHCGCFSTTYMFCGVECWMQPTVGDTEKEKATKLMSKICSGHAEEWVQAFRQHAHTQ